MPEKFIENGADGSQERIRVSPDRLLSLENGFAAQNGIAISPITALHEFWSTCRHGRSVPRFEVFNEQCRWSANPALRISYIDVRHDNPWHYVLTDHDGLAFGSLSGKALSEYPIHQHAKSCALEYLECKSFGLPVAHYVDQQMGGIEREYVRLLLPLADRDNQVTKLAYAYRHLKQPSPT